MSPRKLLAMIEAHVQIEDVQLSRLAYVIHTGKMPGRNGDDDEDDDEDPTGSVYF